MAIWLYVNGERMKIQPLLFLLLFAGIGSVSAQAGKEHTPALIQSRKFTFFATSATPQYSAELARIISSIPGSTGSKVSLNAAFSQLEFKKDTLEAFLPYFGRSQGVISSIDPDDQGIRFTSTDFTYSEEKGKKGNFIISMVVNDTPERPRMVLEVTTHGYATLSVNFNSRSPITYSGYIDKSILPKKKKKAI